MPQDMATKIDGDLSANPSIEYYTQGVQHYILNFSHDAQIDISAHSQGSVLQKPGVADMKLRVNFTDFNAHDYDFENYFLDLKHSLILKAGENIEVVMTTSNANATEDSNNTRLKINATRVKL